MSTTNSHAKNRGKKMTAAQKKQAKLDAYRKARRQWYLVAALVVTAIIVAIVLFAIFTEGEIPIQNNPNL